MGMKKVKERINEIIIDNERGLNHSTSNPELLKGK